MTQIERFVYDGANPINVVPCVHKIEFAEGTLTVRFANALNEGRMDLLTFVNTTITSIWVDGQDSIAWPLDIIGFDCYPEVDDWRFNLNCDVVEFGWRSRWPSRT